MLYLTYRPANGFKRALAFLIDVLPIYLLLYFLSVKVYGISPVPDAMASDEEVRRTMLAHAAITGAVLPIWTFYCMLAELSPWHGTYGKKAMGIRVRCCIDRDKNYLTFRQVFTRNAAKFLSAAPLYLGFIWAFFTNGNRAWHDSLSKTAVSEA